MVLRSITWAALATAMASFAACKGSDGESMPDAAFDAAVDAPNACEIALKAYEKRPLAPASLRDEFGPNAVLSKTASPLARINVYEVSIESVLTNVEIYLNPPLPKTWVTITIAQSASKTMPFMRIETVMVPISNCPGYISPGALNIPLHAGSFYAIGFDPNQAVNYATATEVGSLPIDGAFGRLIGSRTDTSVSLPTLSWDKFSDKEYFRQRITTAPPSGPVEDPDAGL
jgi:hypothetical protein